MKKAFITGGCGMIGSHLVSSLLSHGIEVTAYDNLCVGRMENVSQHYGNPKFHLLVGDILDPPALEHAMQGHDCVWHLAANPLVAMSGRYDAELKTNLVGTFNVLEAMRKLDIKEILFSSTGAVYGDEPGKHLNEDYGPLHPISLYAASKIGAEAFVLAYAHLFGLKAWVFRFANVVGGGMTRGVIHDFVKKLRANPRRLEIWGDGLGQKPYFLVEDCLAGMLCAYDSGQPGTYNLGAATPTAVDRIARIVIEEMGLEDVEITHAGGRFGFPGDVPSVDLNTMKMAALGWSAGSSERAVRLAARRIIRGER